ncbi:MAG TPA: hypothetical protein VIY29_29335, partial [Ktedonobacteraceae bacterium]
MDVNLREISSSAVLEEKKKLKKEFNYVDMIFYTLAALIGLDTLGAFAANGSQALTWPDDLADVVAPVVGDDNRRPRLVHFDISAQRRGDHQLPAEG